MKQNVLIDKEVKKKYLNFIKSQEVLSEPFRDKEGQLNNFYLPIAKLIKKKLKKKHQLLDYQVVKAQESLLFLKY